MTDDAKAPETPTPPEAAADKPAGPTPGEPLKAEPSRTDAPGAGASAAPVAQPRAEPPAPKPENPAAAQTATTSETSSATGAASATADATRVASASPAATPASAPQAPAGAAEGKPAAPGKASAAEAAAKVPTTAAKAAAPGAGAAAKPAPAAAKAPHPPPAPAPPSGPPDPPPPAGTEPPSFIATLQSAIPGSVAAVSYWVGDWTIIVPAELILEVSRHLRDAPDARFDFCSDVTATDWPPRKAGRFDVVYCLYSTRLRHRIRVKAIVGVDQPLASVTGVWPAANWLEREVYDMFGVLFTGHPDRRRILMPEDWQGFPQRKDYPLEGPGELLMENPIDWLKLRQARDEADIE